VAKVTLRVLIGVTLICSAAVQVAAAQPASPAPETISLNQVVALQLGGNTPVEKERHYALPLALGESVIIDVVPVDPTAFRPRPVTPATLAARASGASSQSTPSRPFIETRSPSGEVQRTPNMSASSLGARPSNRLPIETAVGDYGVRLGLSPPVAGTYDVRVGYDGSRATAFELLVRQRSLPPPPRKVAVALGQEVDDQLADGERIFYQFTAPAGGKWISMDMSSTELDSYLDLRGPGNEDAPRIDVDDDSGFGERDARIVARLAAGQYTIIAHSVSHGGHFRFKIAEFTPPEVHARPLSEGLPIKGHFAGMPEGIFAGDNAGGYQVYKLDGEAGQRFRISMRSEVDDIDPFLQVVAPATASDETSQQDLAIVAENDDSAEEGGFNSRVQLRFNQKGTVFVRAGAAGNKAPSGDYTITVTPVN
jgi:hypothetical protein